MQLLLTRLGFVVGAMPHPLQEGQFEIAFCNAPVGRETSNRSPAGRPRPEHRRGCWHRVQQAAGRCLRGERHADAHATARQGGGGPAGRGGNQLNEVRCRRSRQWRKRIGCRIEQGKCGHRGDQQLPAANSRQSRITHKPLQPSPFRGPAPAHGDQQVGSGKVAGRNARTQPGKEHGGS